ncbi:MAG TPA: non-canonical purine NTP pyrophosphatase, RdgB/HAM1 family [Chloroflexi bacterium]|nr:non-canonical purine NTP pyrophosphatase, RdgB/HAM1 family [Chloroflexota bacterium]HHW85858.1 RdgB/HAM1 family non-canonical purine NTP pyrophosphatase [Chloroflexota bacterium]
MNSAKLLVATHNPGKAREYARLLADLPLAVTWLADVNIADAVEETGATFTENALLKARHYAELTGLLTWADDSGLEVDALGGEPGVFSARYGGPGLSDQQRCAVLLTALNGTPEPQRTARFRCVVALAHPDGRTWTTTGAVEGCILTAPRGANGFGYDPVFFVPAYAASMAELPAAVKNQISHRAIAAAHARRLLADLLAGGLME